MPGKPKGLSCQEDSLNPQQVTDLLLACDSLKDRFMTYTMIFAGLRVSELVHLKRSWVNFEEQTVTVPLRQYCQCWECRKKREGIWRPKSRKGARSILLHPQLQPVMVEFLAGNDGLGITRQRVWQRLKVLATRAGILHNIYPHALRSTSATRLAIEKVSAVALKYIMGWASLTTADSYVKSDMHQAQAEQREIYASTK